MADRPRLADLRGMDPHAGRDRAFRPERVAIAAGDTPPREWTIILGDPVHFVLESMIAAAYADRRKAGRRIRQQRRRWRRMFGGDHG